MSLRLSELRSVVSRSRLCSFELSFTWTCCLSVWHLIFAGSLVFILHIYLHTYDRHWISGVLLPFYTQSAFHAYLLYPISIKCLQKFNPFASDSEVPAANHLGKQWSEVTCDMWHVKWHMYVSRASILPRVVLPTLVEGSKWADYRIWN